MSQGPIDGLLDDTAVFRVGSHLISDILFELIVVDVDVFASILLQPLYVFTA